MRIEQIDAERDLLARDPEAVFKSQRAARYAVKFAQNALFAVLIGDALTLFGREFFLDLPPQMVDAGNALMPVIGHDFDAPQLLQIQIAFDDVMAGERNAALLAPFAELLGEIGLEKRVGDAKIVQAKALATGAVLEKQMKLRQRVVTLHCAEFFDEFAGKGHRSDRQTRAIGRTRFVGELGANQIAVKRAVALEIWLVSVVQKAAHRFLTHQIGVAGAVEPRIAERRSPHIGLQAVLWISQWHHIFRRRRANGTRNQGFKAKFRVGEWHRAAGKARRPFVFVVEPDQHFGVAARLHHGVAGGEPLLAQIRRQKSDARMNKGAAPTACFHQKDLAADFRWLHALVPTPKRHRAKLGRRIGEMGKPVGF